MLFSINLRRIVALTPCLMWSCAAFAEYRTETLVEGLSVPWGMVFPPDGEMLVSEQV